jgi:hypothetical protein
MIKRHNRAERVEFEERKGSFDKEILKVSKVLLEVYHKR